MKPSIDRKAIAARMANIREWARSLHDHEILQLIEDNRGSQEMVALKEEAKRRGL